MRKNFLFFLFILSVPAQLFASGDVSIITGLNFGTVVPLTVSGGSVTINATGGSHPSGVNVSSATPSESQYILNSSRCKCTLTWSGWPSSMTLTGSNGGTLTITNFTSSYANFNTNGNCTVTGGNYAKAFWQQPPYATWYIGATANITSATKPGIYNGSFDIVASGREKEQSAFGGNQCQTLSSGFDAADAKNTVPVSVVVSWPLTVSETQQLDFGRIVKPVSACEVVISPTGAVSSSCQTLSGSRAGAFKVYGVGGAAVSYSIASTTLGGMTLDAFTTLPSGAGTLSPAGEMDIAVGARLQVPAGKDPGVYTGVYTITVNYQ